MEFLYFKDLSNSIKDNYQVDLGDKQLKILELMGSV